MDAFSRRRFLKRSALTTGALVVGFYLPGRSRIAHASASASLSPNAFLTITPDDRVIVYVNHSEMGQGVYTALPMLVAEELDAQWDRIEVQAAPVEPRYAHPWMGQYVTGGSTSVSSSWEPLRTAGATARALLRAAAARAWGVEASAVRTANGALFYDDTNRTMRYGEATQHAHGLEAPDSVPLKPRAQWSLIGRNVRRIEGPSKVDGSAEFGLDVRRPGMLTALIARPPVCGATLGSLQARVALAIDGVVKVKPVTAGVAVIARDFWTAKKGRDALVIEWQEGANANLSTDELREHYRALSAEPGQVAERVGDAESALGDAARTLEASYEVPYLAHAPMEPLNCTAEVHADSCDLWVGTQFQGNDQRIAAEILGLAPEKVRIHTTLLGGGFGRRANFTSDFVRDGVEVAKDEPVAVKTVWTREDDIQCGYYRPMYVHRLRAGLDAHGSPTAWHQRVVGQSIISGTRLEAQMVDNGVDRLSIEGAVHMPYAIPNRQIELHSPPTQVPVLWWRSVGHSHTGFANECFLDELAAAADRDPYEYRRDLLEGAPRHRHVLDVAADKAKWGEAPPSGRARGIAMRESFGSFVAQVAEVSVEAGRPRVHRVVCAIDCGIAVNPWNIEAQMQGAIVYGLTAALYGAVTFEHGRVQQSNFHDYPMLRIHEMPEVEVHIIDSDEPPSGVGEPGVPPIAPAVANALFALTGKRVRRLPIVV